MAFRRHCGKELQDSFIFSHIQINKEYTSDELQEFGQEYFKELNKYTPELRQHKKPSTQSLNTLLGDYFVITKSSKRIDGKKQQVTKILKKKSVLKLDIKINKNLITPEDTDELYEELYNVTAFIDFLAMDDEPQKRITVKEYKELFVREKELQKILKAIENDKESLGSLNRTFSYIDEWL